MRAAERETAGEALPARNAQELSTPVLLLALAAAFSLFVGLCLPAAGSDWFLPRIVTCGALATTCICLLLALASQRRYWWATRIVAGLLGFSCFAGVYLTAWFPPSLARDPRLPAVFMVTVCFLVMGVPALCFMLWGHTGGKLARADVERVTVMDLWTARLLVLLRYALFIAVAFYLVRLFYLEMILYRG